MNYPVVAFGALFALYGYLLALWKLARWYLLMRSSGMPELQSLGQDRSTGERIKGQVVICGGSIAGLLAARVCHDHFERVIIVEPEGWLTSEDGMCRFGWTKQHKRTRVMQYMSLHACQSFLYNGLTKLFSDLEEQCAYSGITIADANFRPTFAGSPLRFPLKSLGGIVPKTMYVSRPGSETLMRRLIIGGGHYSRIEQIEGTVTGIVADAENSSVVRKVLVRNKADGQIQEVKALLVIDCTGITRAGVKWLSQAGYGTSPSGIYPASKLPLKDLKLSFDQKLHYSSLLFTLPSSLLEKLPISGGLAGRGSIYMFIEDQPNKGRRMFVITKPDGDRLMLFVGQSANDAPTYDTLDSVRAVVHDLVPYKDPIPDWVFQIMDMLEGSKEVNYTAWSKS